MTRLKVTQRGFIAVFYKVLGWISVFITLFCMLSLLVIYAAMLFVKPISLVSVNAVAAIIFIFGILPFTWFAFYALWRFPDITCDDSGIEIQVVFLRSNYKWSDILKIIETKGLFRYKAILLKKGLPMQWLYGLSIRQFHPTTLVSQSAENLDVLQSVALERITNSNSS